MTRKSFKAWAVFWAPAGMAVLKIAVSWVALRYYIAQYLRLTYIADGLTRALLAYDFAHLPLVLLPKHQWPPLPVWLWGGLLTIWPDIYWSGTALNIAADAGTVFFIYMLTRRLAGDAAAVAASLLLIFSPVHHNLTLGVGMSEPLFFCATAAGIYFAARAEDGKWGALAAGWLFLAAALTRYEGTLLLAAYGGYRLVRRRPKTFVGWLGWGLPLAVAGVFLGVKAWGALSGGGFAPALEGVKADSEYVLPHAAWWRRLLYLFERLWLDGRGAAVLGLLGAAWVWRRGLRDPARLAIWGGWAISFLAVGGVIALHGTGFCPERHLAVVLMLLFPFAAFAAREGWRLTSDRVPGRVAAAVVLAAALGYQVYFDIALKDYGYGYKGPCFTCQTLDAEVGVKLRELWRSGELGPREYIYMEGNTDSWANLGVAAFSDHPRNFFIAEPADAEFDMARLPTVMKRNGFRIAIAVNLTTRAAMKRYYQGYKDRELVVFELPAHTIVVRAGDWRRGTPVFESRFIPEMCRIIGMR